MALRTWLTAFAAILALSAFDLAPAHAQDDATELSFWESVRDSEAPEELEAYLKAYPQGAFSPLARIRLKSLLGTEASPSEKPTEPKEDAAPTSRSDTATERDGSVDRGWLGVVIQNVNGDIADSLGLSEPMGAVITKVTEDGPAAKEDIKVGDVIVEVNGQDVKDARDLARKIAELDPDSKVELAIVRYGDKRMVDLKLGAFPTAQDTVKPSDASPLNADDLGDLEDLGDF